jgi:hypothetical protein
MKVEGISLFDNYRRRLPYKNQDASAPVDFLGSLKKEQILTVKI